MFAFLESDRSISITPGCNYVNCSSSIPIRLRETAVASRGCGIRHYSFSRTIIGIPNFTNFCFSQNQTRVHTFLSRLFNVSETSKKRKSPRVETWMPTVVKSHHPGPSGQPWAWTDGSAKGQPILARSPVRSLTAGNARAFRPWLPGDASQTDVARHQGQAVLPSNGKSRQSLIGMRIAGTVRIAATCGHSCNCFHQE